MKIAVVNRYYPPSMASSGDLAHHFVHELKALLPNDDVFVVTTNASYRGGWRGELDLSERIVRTNVLYDGNHQVLRTLSGFYEGWKLSRIACREADVVISLTNPPLINYWMGRYTRAKARAYVEWTLDVFPVALAHAGYISDRNPAYRYFLRACRQRTPEFNLFLGEGQRSLVQNVFNQNAPYRIMPSGLKDVEAGPLPEWKKGKESKVFVGYVGNIGEAHSYEALLKFARKAPEDRFEIVLSMYGVKADLLRKGLKGRKNITWVDSIPDPDLLHLDVHLVSLLASWTHISVPSKAVTAISIGRPILFIGEQEADTWRMFHEAGWIIREKDLKGDALARLYESVSDRALVSSKTDAAKRLATEMREMRRETIEALADWIKEREGR